MNALTVEKDRLNINPLMVRTPETVVYIVREITRRDDDFDHVRAIVTDEYTHVGGLYAVRELRTITRTVGTYQIIGKRYAESDSIFGFVPNKRVHTWDLV